MVDVLGCYYCVIVDLKLLDWYWISVFWFVGFVLFICMYNYGYVDNCVDFGWVRCYF